MFDVQEAHPVLLRRWLDGDRIAGREAARLHYDHLLLRKLGLQPINRTIDERDESLIVRDRLDLQEQIVRGLLAVAAGDPNPSPNLTPLFDPEVRAESIRALTLKLSAAVEVLKRELEQAESKQKPVALPVPRAT